MSEIEDDDTSELRSDEASYAQIVAKHAHEELLRGIENDSQLSARQRAVAYDTAGILKSISEGIIEGHPRLLDNMIEIMTLYGNDKPNEAIEEAVKYALMNGVYAGITEEKRGNQHGKSGGEEWRQREASRS